MHPEEVSRLQSYLQGKLKNTGFALKIREKARDSVEVLLNGEFIGVIYKDEDGDFNFDMPILEIDLPGATS
ncbi:MAG: DUF3126 family protein [Rhodospirillales bacterium]|nr:DUF3126 family protein [Alphaproteobacteria bacterium]USO06694.1 MAG: DUF3126 family protein [Rhodospirillales bacterium]